jgi:hypothetical protein
MIVADGTMRLESPVRDGEAINISSADHRPTSITRAIWVGTGGNLKVTTDGGTALTFVNVQDGTLLPVQSRLIWQTGTTASNMLALW